jgi:hypothetical protein
VGSRLCSPTNQAGVWRFGVFQIDSMLQGITKGHLLAVSPFAAWYRTTSFSSSGQNTPANATATETSMRACPVGLNAMLRFFQQIMGPTRLQGGTVSGSCNPGRGLFAASLIHPIAHKTDQCSQGVLAVHGHWANKAQAFHTQGQCTAFGDSYTENLRDNECSVHAHQ